MCLCLNIVVETVNDEFWSYIILHFHVNKV